MSDKKKLCEIQMHVKITKTFCLMWCVFFWKLQWLDILHDVRLYPDDATCKKTKVKCQPV
jgi:hypothetical protein